MVQRSRRLLLACPLALLVAAAPAPAAEISITATPVSADIQKVVVSGTADTDSPNPSSSYISLYSMSRAARACPASAEAAGQLVYDDQSAGQSVVFPQVVAPGPFTVERSFNRGGVVAPDRLCVYLTHYPSGRGPVEPPVEVMGETVVKSLGETVGWTVHGAAVLLLKDGTVGFPAGGGRYTCSVKGSTVWDPSCEFSLRYTISTTKAWAKKLGLPSTTILSVAISRSVAISDYQDWPKKLPAAVRRKLWSRGAGKVPLIHRLTVHGPTQGSTVVRGRLGSFIHGLSAALPPRNAAQ